MNINNWIWTDSSYEEEKPVICLFRKAFILNEKPGEKTYVRVSADTRYRFYVNGKFICTGPRRGDGQQWFYERVDINPYLKAGINVIGAEVLRYPAIPYRGFRSAWRTQTPGLMVWSENEGIPSTDKSWKCLIARQIEVCSRGRDYIRLYQEETVKGDILFRDWLKPDFNDKEWNEPITYKSDLLSRSVSPMFMKERTIPLMYEHSKRFVGINHIVTSSYTEDDYNKMLKGEKAIIIKANSHETVDIVAERLTTAYLELAVSSGAGSKITITASEAYCREEQMDGMPVTVKEDRLDYTVGDPRGPVDEFYPGGYGTAKEPEYYEPFSFREFRLIRLDVETGDQDLVIENFSYRETAYPLEVKSHVETSDPKLKEIWQISENTLRMCMHETYEDCPGFEQLQYAMDTRSQILFTYCISGDDRLARAAIDDFSRSQRPDGLIAACYPSFKSNVIPSFSVYYVLMLHDHMMYFGDKSLLRHYYPSVMRACEFFTDKLNDKNLVGIIENMGFLNKCYWGYIDSIDGWPIGVPPVPQDKEITLLSLLTMTMVKAAGEIGEYIGFHDVAKEYLQIADRIRAAVRKHCIGKNGLIQDAPGLEMYSQMSQIFGVLNDVFDHQEAVKALYSTIDDSMVSCSLPITFYQFRALEKEGLYEHATKIFERWSVMLGKNLTTCTEHDFKNQQRSDCHAWSAVPLYELTSAVLGVSPASPGYGSVRFSPQPMHLNWAKGQVITPKGMIKVSWEVHDGNLIKEIEVPEGLEIIQ